MLCDILACTPADLVITTAENAGVRAGWWISRSRDDRRAVAAAVWAGAATLSLHALRRDLLSRGSLRWSGPIRDSTDTGTGRN